MANAASNNLTELISEGTINFDSDVFKIILMSSGFVYNRVTHDDYSDVSANELPTANGYTAGGATLAGVAVTRDNINNWTLISWNNVVWTAAGGPIGPASGAIIYDDTVVNDPIVGYIDFGGNYTQADGGTATIIDPAVRVRG